jgi:hypothetical protein
MVVFTDQPGLAGSPVQTRHFLAANQRHGTIFAAKTIFANALVVGNHINTPGFIFTRVILLTLVDINLAPFLLKSRVTLTSKLINSVHTGRPVLTGLGLTLVNVNLAVNTCKTRQTVANVSRSILVLKTQTEKSSNSLRKSGHILI